MTGKDIKAVRKRLGMTQVMFAKAMTVSFCTLNRWERGHNVPQPDRMERLRNIRKCIRAVKKQGRLAESGLSHTPGERERVTPSGVQIPHLPPEQEALDE